MPQADLDTVLQYFAIMADKPDIPFDSDYPAFVKSVMLDDECRKALVSLIAVDGGTERARTVCDIQCLRNHAAKSDWSDWQDALLKFVYLCRLFGIEAK